jgi:heat shock protein HslJ
MTVSPVAATKVACPDPILNQETAFFTALAHASRWGYQVGNLTISYDNGQGGFGTLVFAPQPAAPPVLTAEQLKNATYSGIYDDMPVTLTDGKYEGEPFSADSPIRPKVTLLDDGIIFGDLNGDGSDDAAVFLVENSGGTGQFIYVSAQLNQNGQPLNAGIVGLGDRIAIKSVAIENNQVVVEIVTQGPGDGACCPTLKVRATYALQDGALAEVGSEELGKISAADLNGTIWTLVDLNFDQQPALADTPVTISFQDGQISGSGGCNSYNGSFTLAEENPFGLSIGPVAATQKACPDPILNQETAYFSALEHASQWGYRVGRLAIYYSNDQNGFGTLLFTPQTAAEANVSQLEQLTASTWQWVRLTDPQQQVEVTPPENYTLTFMPDGILQIKADCNQATASYTAGKDGALAVTPGITTLVACLPGSRGEELIQKLGSAAIYFFQNDNLFIDLMADGGTLEFSKQP